jgi:cytochrome o ubiquinol oxidase subunit II
MKSRYKVALIVMVTLAVLATAAFLLRDYNWGILDPKGAIAIKQRQLMVTATALMLIVVVPVYALTAFITWRYRATNTKAKYTPDWDHHRVAETIWWAVPSAIIGILAVITWNSSHELDPYRTISSSTKPMTIQVVALQWKWLFIYPDQHIATINYVRFPKNVPINFVITSDAPMNSFWIPQLGGQIYAMSGMSTQLHLIANDTGNFSGSSANISGEGFAGMKFVASASTQSDFDDWAAAIRRQYHPMDLAAYNALAQPSKDSVVTAYSPTTIGLYDDVVNKYMTPDSMLDHSMVGAH